MSVAENIQLPNQPTSGTVENQGLGGDGFRAPFSATIVDINLAGDASGGTNAISVRFDPNYISMVSYVTLLVTGAAAEVDGRVQIVERGPGAFQRGTLTTIIPIRNGSVGLGGDTASMWIPPPVLISADPDTTVTNAPFFRWQGVNTNGEENFLSMKIYNYDKRARESVPLDLLLASVPRAGAIL